MAYTRFRTFITSLVPLLLMITIHLTVGVASAQVPTPTLSIETSTLGERVVMIGLDGQVPLYDDPEARNIRTWRTAGTIAVVLNSRFFDNQWWLLIKTLDGQRGWLTGDMVKLEKEVGATFGNFRFCVGSLHYPTNQCNDTLSLGHQTRVWLFYDYGGLQPNDITQVVLEIKGERYAFAPESWESRTSSGRQLLSLATVNPRPIAGTWIVEFYVNSTLRNQATVWVRSLP